MGLEGAMVEEMLLYKNEENVSNCYMWLERLNKQERETFGIHRQEAK